MERLGVGKLVWCCKWLDTNTVTWWVWWSGEALEILYGLNLIVGIERHVEWSESKHVLLGDAAYEKNSEGRRKKHGFQLYGCRWKPNDLYL